MVKKVWNWVVGWIATLDLKYRYPEVYKYLTEEESKTFDEKNFIEVGQPHASWCELWGSGFDKHCTCQ